MVALHTVDTVQCPSCLLACISHALLRCSDAFASQPALLTTNSGKLCGCSHGLAVCMYQPHLGPHSCSQIELTSTATTMASTSAYRCMPQVAARLHASCWGEQTIMVFHPPGASCGLLSGLPGAFILATYSFELAGLSCLIMNNSTAPCLLPHPGHIWQIILHCQSAPRLMYR